MRTWSTATLGVALLSLAAPAWADTKVDPQYGAIARHFEANLGQSDPQVRYLSRGGGYTLFLLDSGEALLKLRAGSKDELVRLTLPGSRKSPTTEPRKPLPGRSAYFVGNDPAKWRTGIPHYEAVAYREVFPGIDLVYYGNDRKLEFDFVVSPGADPRSIRMRFEGVKGQRLDGQGQLVLKTPSGELIQRAPLVYQEQEGTRTPVRGRYALRGGEVRFEVDAFDARTALVIDPILEWSTYLGGSGIDNINGLALDSSGHSYVTGTTQSADFPTGFGLNGTSDAFVTKLDDVGRNVVYSTYLGGSGTETGFAITLDASNNAYVAGQTSSTDFPSTAFGVQTTFGGGAQDAFLAVLDGSGNQSYATYLGGTGTDVANAISLSSAGAVYLAGTTLSANFPTAAPFDGTKGSSNDAFVSKIDTSVAGPSGLLYSTFLGGTNVDIARAVVASGSDVVYVAGETAATNFPTAGTPVQAVYGGGTRDAFLSQLDTTTGAAGLLFSTYLGGSLIDRVNAAALDSSGHVYLAGDSTSANLAPVGTSAAGPRGGQDAFIARVDVGAGSLLYLRHMGGGQAEAARAVVTNGTTAIVAGTTNSGSTTGFEPITTDAIQFVKSGQADTFVVTVDGATDTVGYATYLGGAAGDPANGVATDGVDVWVAGNTASPNFPTNVRGRGDPFQPASAGAQEGFISRIRPLTPSINLFDPSAGQSLAVGSTHSIKWGHNLGKYTFVRLERSLNGGSTWTTIAGSVSNRSEATSGQFNSSVYQWTVAAPGALPNPNAVIRATWLANNNVTSQTGLFTIGNASFNWTSPGNPLVFEEGEVRNLNWTSNVSANDNVSVGVRINGAGNCLYIDTLRNGDKPYAWTVGTTAGGPITIDADGVPAQMCVRFPPTAANWNPGAGNTALSPTITLCPSGGCTP